MGLMAGCILLDFMKGIAMVSCACPSCKEQGISGFAVDHSDNKKGRCPLFSLLGSLFTLVHSVWQERVSLQAIIVLLCTCSLNL